MDSSDPCQRYRELLQRLRTQGSERPDDDEYRFGIDHVRTCKQCSEMTSGSTSAAPDTGSPSQTD